MPRRIFISSVQSEFAVERRNIRDFVRDNALLSRHFEVFLFEDQPAQTRSPVDLYLGELDQCDVYVALMGIRYGYEDNEGISPTEREFDRAVERRKHRLVFIRDVGDEEKEPKEAALISRAEGQLTRRTFVGIPDLTAQLYRSLIVILEAERVLNSRPFDAQSTQLSLSFIDDRRVEEFTTLATAKRGVRFRQSATTRDRLMQLNLFDHDRPTNAAFMLFSGSPQRVASGAEVKCLHFGGPQPHRPAISHKVYKGSIFEQVDLAVAFVMDRLAAGVGQRNIDVEVPTSEEIPKGAVTEALVNAIAHRDYLSTAAVQVTVFSDRVEIANPGELPRGLTPAQLFEIHSSIPKNPLIAEGLFLAGYMDTVGTGTLEIIRLSREAGLPDPTFQQRGDQWTVTLWRDWMTDAVLSQMGLNDRQLKAMASIKVSRRIDNSEYQHLTGASKRTASRDLRELADRGIVVQVGADVGRGIHYERSRSKGATKGPKGPKLERGQKGAKGAKTPKRTSPNEKKKTK
jgi:predicted HTH transcriptional regulator